MKIINLIGTISKKFLFINLIAMIFLALLKSGVAMDVEGGLVPLEERSRVFQTYYLENPNNPDPGIFAHMKQWHDDDFIVLSKRVKAPQSQERLRLVFDTLNKSFEDKSVSHTKIAAAYGAYSYVLSSKSELEAQGNDDKAESDSKVEGMIRKAVQYITQGTWDHVHYMDFSCAGCREKNNLKWLPFVSENGVASVRALNCQFGMKAPIKGVPLNISSYDGNINIVPSDFSDHDSRHGVFGDSQTRVPAVIDFIFDCYRQADSLVRQIEDPRTKALCDFFLDEVGHENIFGVLASPQPTCWAGLTIPVTIPQEYRYDDNSQDKEYIFVPHSLDEVSDSVCRRLVGDIQARICCSVTFNNLPVPVGGQIGAASPPKDSLVPFLKPGPDQLLYSLVELITHFNIKRTGPLTAQDITEPVVPGYCHMYTFGPWDIFGCWTFHMGLQVYNQLFDKSEYFNNNGINFDIWKDNTFQAEAMISVYHEACDAFKREVASKFKGFEDLAEKVRGLG